MDSLLQELNYVKANYYNYLQKNNERKQMYKDIKELNKYLHKYLRNFHSKDNSNVPLNIIKYWNELKEKYNILDKLCSKPKYLELHSTTSNNNINDIYMWQSQYSNEVFYFRTDELSKHFEFICKPKYFKYDRNEFDELTQIYNWKILIYNIKN